MNEVFLFSLAAAFLFSIGSLFDKFILENKMPNALAYFFLQSIFAVTLFPLTSFLLFGIEIPEPFTFVLILFAAIAVNIGFLFYFKLVKRFDLSSVGPLTQTRPLFAIPLGAFFLNEFYGFEALLLMLLIFAGALLTTYSKEFSIRAFLLENKILFLALLMTLFWVIADLPAKLIMQDISAASFMIWRYLFSIPIIAIMAIFLLKKEPKTVFVKNAAKTIPFALVAAAIGFTGIMFLFIAYSFSYTIPSAVVSSQAMFVFIIAFIVSRIKPSIIEERHPLGVYLVRFLGVILISSSIYFLMNMAMVI